MNSFNTRQKRQRRRMFERQRGICFYCPQKMLLNTSETNPQRCTCDHRVPIQRGGLNVVANKVACCFACNQDKGALTEREFRLLGREEARRINAAAAGAGARGGAEGFRLAIVDLVSQALSLKVTA